MDKTEALRAVEADPSRTPQERAVARVALAAMHEGTKQELSDDAKAMLREFGKPHLAEVAEEEFWKYVHRHGGRPICGEYWDWHCLPDEFLELLGESRLWHWQKTYRCAQTDDVRAHALAEIHKLTAREQSAA